MFGKKTEKIIEEKKVREVSIFREYVELFSETLVYVFFVMTFLLQSFVIPTGSMQNNILIGDHLLVNKVAYSRSQGSIDDIIFPQKKIARGSIVTFKAPAEMDKEYVKRVIGLPGETISIVNKNVYIDGKLLNEPYVHFDQNNITGGYGDNFPLQQPRYIDVLGKISFLPFYINDANGYIDVKRTSEVCEQFKDAVISAVNEKVFKVPEGYYFCMGDNRDHSYDSRFWGPVPANYIIGKPWRVYWSYESSTEDYLTPGMQHKLKDIARTIINFFSKTRWNRTIMKIQ
ncbi:MAG: signal peptidase I [Acidobacteria bacterium]|jgi:signal peptidase I|nr:signal peptidase I [Acidobacteriota bacterium]